MIRFTRNVAINIRPELRKDVAAFYRSLGLSTQDVAPDFTVLSDSPYGSYVVSWEPLPALDGEICLQFETDEIEAIRERVESAGGSVLFFGSDPNNPGHQHLWFRDPAGCLINVVETSKPA